MSQTSNEVPESIQDLGPEQPRQDMIATAVKFLQNPKVQNSPLEQKKSFLKKKGLTEEEIQMAVSQSGATDVIVSHTSPALPGNQTNIPASPAPIPVQEVTLWNRFQSFSTVAVIVGGVVYALYSLFKKFIEPIFIRQQKEMDDKLNKMEEGIADLNSSFSSNIKEIQASIDSIKSEMADQSLNVSRMANNLVSYKVESSSNSGIGDLQSEISSIKGLLLSSRQFPAAPVNPPVIPSWQLKDEISNHPEMEHKPSDQVLPPTVTNGAGDSSTLHSSDQHQNLEDSGSQDERVLVNGHSEQLNLANTEVLTPSETHVLSIPGA